jgi:tRNA(Ile)-lysidine synthase
MALMHLLIGSGCQPQVVTVDHGLRAESAGEAEWVAAKCAELGLDHKILKWTGWDGRGNLQDAARTARRRLIADWAKARGIGSVALGHTQDDQAETFLIRLARGSGVDGLSGMAGANHDDGIAWIRPMLGLGRQELRDWLRGRGLEWLDDPSNEDERFDRVRMRRLMPVLSEAGLTVDRLSATVTGLARAREALEHATLALANEAAAPSDLGDVVLDLALLEKAPEELRLRLLAWSLQWVSGEGYRPRLASLEAIAETYEGSLHGCLVRREKRGLSIRREPARCGSPVAAGEVWDGRWETSGPEGVEVRALGEEGLLKCPDWRETGHPRETLLSTPGFWRGGELLANPFVKPGAACDAWLKGGKTTYFNGIIRR